MWERSQPEFAKLGGKTLRWALELIGWRFKTIQSGFISAYFTKKYKILRVNGEQKYIRWEGDGRSNKLGNLYVLIEINMNYSHYDKKLYIF